MSLLNPSYFELGEKKKHANNEQQHSHTRVLTCGLLRVPKFMLGVDGRDTDGEPREEVMTE